MKIILRKDGNTRSGRPGKLVLLSRYLPLRPNSQTILRTTNSGLVPLHEIRRMSALRCCVESLSTYLCPPRFLGSTRLVECALDCRCHCAHGRQVQN